MDKHTVFVAILLVASTSAFLIKVPTRTVPTKERPSSTGWIHLQKLVLPLFENICEDSSNPIIVRLAQEFNAGASSGLFLKPEVTNDFNSLKSKGFLPKGETFVVFNPEHKNELKIIFELFYYAKDFDTFYKAAAWARQNVNCGLFMNAIYLAMLNRRDTEHLSVPAPYELLPNYFIRKDYIIKASSLLSNEEIISEDVLVEGNSYIVDTNYTSDFFSNDFESKLAYFQEDIGLNSYYFLQRLKYFPCFKNNQIKKEGYGEYLYNVLKQLSVRYDLERYSNGFPEVEIIDWNNFAATPYDPMLIYSNGNEFGYRTDSKILEKNTDLEQIKGLEMNIRTEVTRMINADYSKAAIFDYLMNVLVTGELSYEALAHSMFGKKLSDNNEPTALAHYLTSLRDPVFWRINKKIVNIVDEILKVLPEYSLKELIFPGVEVKNVEIKKMSTSFDDFVFDVTDALKSEDVNTNFQVKFSQPRLNHKTFTLKLNISSMVSQKGLVKIYLGPKIAPGKHASNKNMFMLLDSFECNLKVGSNAITRSSEAMSNISEDFTMLKTLRKIVEDSEFGIYSSPLKPIESFTGFPSRLVIPKGTPEGVPLQMFVFVAPFVKTTISSISSLNTEFNTAILSPGFPFDLDMKNGQLFRLPNTIIKDFIVTHKGEGKVSGYGRPSNTKPWQEEDTNFDYTAKKNEPFDYSSKKAQYGNRDSITPVQNEYEREDFEKVTKPEKEIIVLTEKLVDSENSFTESSFVPQIKAIENEDDKARKNVPLLKATFENNGYSKNDYSYKRKERFDYKAKKNQYKNKIDYSARRGGYNEKKLDNNNDEMNVYSNRKLDDAEANKRENYNDPIEVIEIEPVDTVGDAYDVIEYKPLLQLSRKRAPSVYDYLFPNRVNEDDDEYENSRIYE